MTDIVTRLSAALADKYEIKRELGAGGMATVYLARDLKHDRDVAVKVLKPELAAALGPDRFLREIKIAAQLQHPHVLPLHDSGEADGFLYYVMPYVRGESLRERIQKQGELPVTEAVKILHEVVDALAHAHEQGVVHRDIKPDNIMISGRHALVMDFGVAKAVSEATGRQQLTTAGIALGTPAYMAPEQATADPNTDHRADIYAVGTVAYELLTGRPPFTGATPQMILAAHVTEQVEPVTKRRDKVSPALEALVMRCLEKKPADRWQSAEEMLPHLEALSTPSGGLTPAHTMPVTVVSRSRRFLSLKVLAGVAVLAVVGFFSIRLLRHEPIRIVVSNERQITSALGLEFEPRLSPDGTKIVYSQGTPYRTHPYVQVLSGGATLALAGDLPGYQREPTWNTTGDSVTFWAAAGPGRSFNHRSSAMLGGALRTLDATAERDRIAWSPDGERVVYVRSDSAFVRASQGGEENFLVEGGPASLRFFSWSPDGRRIAYSAGAQQWSDDNVLGDIQRSSIVVVAADGSEEPVTVVGGDDALNLNAYPVWLPDNRHLLFVSDRGASRAIYVVEVGRNGPVGAVQRLPGGANPHSISVSADGLRLAYSRFDYTRNIFAYRLQPGGTVSIRDGERITSGTEIIERIEISPDGEWIAFDSHINGNHDVFKMRPDGSERTQLTSDPSDNFLRKWSSDGSEVSVTAVFEGIPSGGIVAANGSGEIRTFRDAEWGVWSGPIWSPSGLEVLVGGRDGDTWRAERESPGSSWSEPVRITESDCEWPEWSPDGSMFVCSTEVVASATTTLYARSGEPRWTVRSDQTGAIPRMLRAQFSADGNSIYAYGVAPDGSQGIWAIPSSGGDPVLVMGNDDDALWANLFSFEVGPDNRIYLAVAEYESDIWVMDLEWE